MIKDWIKFRTMSFYQTNVTRWRSLLQKSINETLEYRSIGMRNWNAKSKKEWCQKGKKEFYKDVNQIIHNWNKGVLKCKT